MSTSLDEHFISNMNYFISQIAFYSCNIIANIGILGNFFNLMLCLNQRIARDVMGYFNILMSIFNILSLITAQIHYFPQSIGYQDLTITSDYSCKLLNYFSRVFAQTSAWLNVMATFERIEFFSKHKLFKLITSKYAPAATFLGLLAILLVLNVPNLLFNLVHVSKFVIEKNQTTNFTSCTSTKLTILITNIEISLVRVFLPIVLQTFLTIDLLRYLEKNKQKLNASPKFVNEYGYAVSILILNIIYIITEVPYMTSRIYFGILGATPEYPLNVNTSRRIAIATLIYFVTFFLSSFMFCSLFFVNIFSSRKIRKEIRYIFCGIIATQSIQNTNIFKRFNTIN